MRVRKKRGGAWMDVAVDRKAEGDVVQTPVATLTCNLSRPVGGRPALFTHSEVTTLFHEFGHGLHLLLTQVEHLGTGMENVEWDAIELPSQFMENFCWEWDVVRHMSGHVETGAPLPRSLFDRMVAAKNFHAGMHFIRQLQLALFDLEVHMAGALDLASVFALLQRVRDEVSVLDVPDTTASRCSSRTSSRALCRGLLQLPVGRGAVGRRVQPVRGDGRDVGRGGRALPVRDPGNRVEPRRRGVVRRVPRTAAADRRAVPPQRARQ
jgi:hypothetical protein